MRAGCGMSFDQEIADILARIAKAEFQRDHWRICGRQEKYLEAYFQVDVLGLELDRVRKQRIEAAWKVANSPRVNPPL
jgi:hypothetical protein